MNIDHITTINAGPTALIAALCDELQLESTINSLLDWHPSYWKVSPGTHIKAMIINILCARSPLYQVEDFYSEHDVPLLFGSQRTAHDFNDDALARVLDLVYEAESWKVYSTWSLSVLQRLGLSLSAVHNDTTSFSVSGDYPDTDKLAITYGYSKDKRPDLKQILIGMGVTPERLPLLATVDNGNTNDKTWNFEFITRMRQVLSDEQWAELTYVADSALVTPDNLALLAEQGAAFLTRLPDTYDIAKELRQEAVALNQWEDHGTLGKAAGSSHYRSQSFTRDLYGQTLRFIVVHSSHLHERQARTLDTQVVKERVEIAKQLKTLTAEAFSCSPDAEAALASFRKKHKWKWHTCEWTVKTETYPKRRATRGRPKAGSVPEEGIQYRIHATEPLLNQASLAEHRSRLGMFVLVTNRLEKESWSDHRLLQTYKGQDAAETRFRLLKDPAILDAVYLKTPHRIEALGIVFVMALMVYGVLEWRVRENMKRETEPLILPGKRKSFAPTGEVLLAMLKVVQVILIRMDDGTLIRQLDSGTKEIKKRVLRLAGFDPSIYTTPAPPH